MALSNEIVLRPRFNLELDKNLTSILRAFQNSNSNEFKVKCNSKNIYIEVPETKKHLWSPQLHLKVNQIDEKHSRLKGFFGPKQKVWTFFISLHLIIAIAFITFGIWTYLNWSENSIYSTQFQIMSSMVVCWLILYFAGTIGKAKSAEQMRQLYNFMEDILIKG